MEIKYLKSISMTIARICSDNYVEHLTKGGFNEI